MSGEKLAVSATVRKAASWQSSISSDDCCANLISSLHSSVACEPLRLPSGVFPGIEVRKTSRFLILGTARA